MKTKDQRREVIHNKKKKIKAIQHFILSKLNKL